MLPEVCHGLPYRSNLGFQLKGGLEMHRGVLRVALGLCLVALASLVSAEERIVNLVTCELVEGMTQADVHKANGPWVRYMNENVPGGDIRSAPAVPIVGNWTKFLYIDSFPNLASWSAAMELENAGSAEIQKILSDLDKTASCSKNSLYRAVGSE
jgi:hypothetical protein